jgi:hypothetical protein
METRRRQYGGSKEFNYKSETVHEDLVDGRRESHTKIVEIKNGKGIKRLINTAPSGRRTVRTAKLSAGELYNIRRKIFMPRLFKDLAVPAVRQTRRKKNSGKN